MLFSQYLLFKKLAHYFTHFRKKWAYFNVYDEEHLFYIFLSRHYCDKIFFYDLFKDILLQLKMLQLKLLTIKLLFFKYDNFSINLFQN